MPTPYANPESTYQDAQSIKSQQELQTKTLTIVLMVNFIMFVIELVTGLRASSTALLADAADMLGDSLAFAFSLHVVGRSAQWKVLAAKVKASIMLIFGIFVLVQSGYKIMHPVIPVFKTIGMVAVLALCANIYCFSLLLKHRGDDVNMGSVWLCSRNDIIANIAVIVSAFCVFIMQSQWPDVIVGVGIALLFIRSSFAILKESCEAQKRQGNT